MPDEDLDLAGLATYLHLAPAQVQRLVERGELPSRRVAGQWRFSAAEVHLWLEQRIGVSGAVELTRMESALARPSGQPELDAVSIVELMPLEAIAIPLEARTRGSVITSMCEVAARTGWLWDVERMVGAVRARGDMLPTAQDSGVALLHPRRPLSDSVERAFVALGRTDRGIPFGNPRGVLTDVFLLVCSTDDLNHLRTLARLSRLISAPGFLDELRHAADSRAARELIETTDAGLA